MTSPSRRGDGRGDLEAGQQDQRPAATSSPNRAAKPRRPCKTPGHEPRPLKSPVFGSTTVFHKDPTFKTTPCGLLRIKERLLRAWLAYKRLTGLSFPRRFPVVQFPSLPLIVAVLAGAAGKFLDGSAHSYAASVSYLAMTIWAYEELVHGVSWFRRLLGLAYVIVLVVRVADALHG